MIYPDIEILKERDVRSNAREIYIVVGNGQSFPGYNCVREAAVALGFRGGIVLEHYLGIWINLHHFVDGPYTLPDKLVNLCQALAGGHGHVILKAYRIKKGLE